MVVLKNNQFECVVLEQSKDYSLLKVVTGTRKEYIVAWLIETDLEDKTCNWASAQYFNSIDEALKAYNKKFK